MILVDALFIANHGGGPALLRYLLDRIRERQLQSHFYLLLDERFQHDVSTFQHIKLKAGLKARRTFYKNNSSRFSRVFCFANTPPPIRLRVHVDTYFHNQMLLESTRHLTGKKYWRFYLRYLFVKLYNRNTDNYIVQTKHMVDDIVATGLKKREQCREYPFYRLPQFAHGDIERTNDFLYISTPSFYKNHENLLTAWTLLLERGLSPVLHLTVDETSPALLSRIEAMKQQGIKLVNHGYTDPAVLYKSCSYLIYPSFNESFGLGLIEAAEAGMKILVSDLPYARSVIQPSAFFNPADPAAIADCVSNALKNELPFPEILVKDKVDALIQHLID